MSGRFNVSGRGEIEFKDKTAGEIAADVQDAKGMVVRSGDEFADMVSEVVEDMSNLDRFMMHAKGAMHGFFPHPRDRFHRQFTTIQQDGQVNARPHNKRQLEARKIERWNRKH